ncbi:shikimate kinase [Leptolyngbya cf. ectocarpi LEGE 11479]|uniref:Shikimate kinase n=1 Tax=Leptolyngbya cf. ectocarpi LEGE 11479 TaxID=1828722 RepID=A0A929FAR7_LEPEC|nr:shikimate kinase [Leptolyngbya ectocarpi]MBE9068572.1 shikimate kinase [Leptolyngbya cf. ectocarpi LEGE 11479]
MTAEFLKGTNLYLVGMMGSGKSTLGKYLARTLNYRFIDTDDVIVQAAGQSINDIFSEQGETAFRTLESQVLARVAPYTHTVIATGGGMVVKQENWSHLQSGLVVWIDVAVDELLVRLRRDQSRPLLKSGNLRQKLTTLLEQRQPRYAQADVTVTYQPGEQVGAIAKRTLDTLQTFVAENPATSTTINR